ncbi:MAG: hypothetical protein WA117_08340 [Verrucomicrobiia bacterium]
MRWNIFAFVFVITGVSCSTTNNTANVPDGRVTIAVTPHGTVVAGLLPYSIVAGFAKEPTGEWVPLFVDKDSAKKPLEAWVPSYVHKKITLDADTTNLSLRKALAKLSELSGVSIKVRGGIPASHTKYWDEIRIQSVAGTNSVGYFVREIISYMQEMGLPVPPNLKNPQTQNHRVVALLYPKEVLIDSFLLESERD